MIIEAAEQLIPEFNFKIQFLIGGPASANDKYGQRCAWKMKELRARWPNNFYANPDEFFYDGPLLNLGSDFGLMPSMFEPGGIVQHEFFVAGTPVIAFKTGGLRDTVHEFTREWPHGGGFTFENFNIGDFKYAISRAIGIYWDK